MGDARTVRTDAAIKEAFLDLLAEKPYEDITLSELARAAGVSRSTVYLHFANTAEVREALARDYQREMRSLRLQLHCDDCQTTKGMPYCDMIREAGAFAPLVHDPLYLDLAMKLIGESAEGRDSADVYREAGLSEDMAKLMFLFQMSGCHAVATKAPEGTDWEVVRSMIDCFIRGGIRALAARGHMHR